MQQAEIYGLAYWPSRRNPISRMSGLLSPAAGLVRGLRDRLPARQAERFGMGPAVVFGQDLAEVAWPVRDGAAADLAAGDREIGNSHREAAGT